MSLCALPSTERPGTLGTVMTFPMTGFHCSFNITRSSLDQSAVLTELIKKSFKFSKLSESHASSHESRRKNLGQEKGLGLQFLITDGGDGFYMKNMRFGFPIALLYCYVNTLDVAENKNPSFISFHWVSESCVDIPDTYFRFGENFRRWHLSPRSSSSSRMAERLVKTSQLFYDIGDPKCLTHQCLLLQTVRISSKTSAKTQLQYNPF